MLRDYHVDNNAWNFLALIVFFALKLFKALIRVKTYKQCTRYVFAGFLLHISYQDTFIWCMECWIQSVVFNGPRTLVIFLLCNFAVVLLALEVLAMYLFQTITLTILNRVLNFLVNLLVVLGGFGWFRVLVTKEGRQHLDAAFEDKFSFSPLNKRTTHTHIVSFVLVDAHSHIGPRRIHTLTGIKISNNMQ